MLTNPDLRSKIDSLWDTLRLLRAQGSKFWSGGEAYFTPAKVAGQACPSPCEGEGTC